jgi:choline dehydrogenase-like flavoprotein
MYGSRSFIKKKEYSFNNKYREINKFRKFNIDPNQRKLDSDYPINSDNSPISIANYNAVGGSTLIYSGHYPRFHPSDFKTKKLIILDLIGYLIIMI